MGFKKMDVFLEIFGFFLLFGTLFSLVHGEEIYHTFVIKETNFTKVCYSKPTLVVNESFPGPTLTIHKGDTLYVNVINEGNYGITIHWHGVKQPRNPWFDGPEYITQCPIKAGTNFTYQVLFTSEEGTLWYHAHSDWSRATVHGAIVILPALGTTYPYPEPDVQQVLVFASWYRLDVMAMMNESLAEGGLTKLSDAYTINGEPGDFHNCSSNTTFRMTVDYGKTYLLRIVSSVQNTDMFFAIANHNLTVVGWDATYVKPYGISHIVITPGQTFDVLVKADQPETEYYMVASPYFDGQADDFDKTITTAIFQYSGNYTPPDRPQYPSPVQLPGFYDLGAALSYYESLRSLATSDYPIEVPQTVDTNMYIAASINMLKCYNDSCAGPDGNRIASSLNNLSFANPDVDVLQAYYWNLTGVYNTTFPDRPPNFFNFTSSALMTDNVTMSDQGTKVKVLEYNETVEIVFQGTNVMNSGENHPMHLHGFRFYIVGWGAGNYDFDNDPSTYNLVDPPEANTVPIPKNGWAAIRFKASNPGVWFMHCHFDRHMTWGMNMAFIVKNGGTPETSVRDPPAYMPPCGDESMFDIALRQSYLEQDL